MNDKKEDILHIAEQLFAEHGYEGTSMRLLCKQANINLAMVSYYFGSKEKLFEMLVEKRITHSLELIRQIEVQEDDPWKKIEGVINIYARRLIQNYKFTRIIHREVSLSQRSLLNSALSGMLLSSMQSMGNIIRQGITKGMFREVDVNLTSATIIGTIAHATLANTFFPFMAQTEEMPIEELLPVIENKVREHLHQLIHAHLMLS